MQQRLQCPNGPCWTRHSSQSHTQPLCPPQFQPRFPTAESQMSPSTKPFLPSTVTQKQPELFPQQRNPSVLFPHSLSAQGSSLALSPEPLAPAVPLSVPPPAVPVLLVPFVVLCWQFMGSCLELPPGARPAPGTAAGPEPPAPHNQEEGRVGVRWFQFCLVTLLAALLGIAKKAKQSSPSGIWFAHDGNR